MLNDPHIGGKTYRKSINIVRKFMHERKIHLIPPILINYTFVTDVNKRIFFCCTSHSREIQNTCTLPDYTLKQQQLS